MQERLDLNKTQGASILEEVKRMKNVPYASDVGSIIDDIKSQTGYVFILNGGAVDWKSSKQSTTAMSATEAEYIAASKATMEAVWIRKFISWLGIVPTINEPIKMFCDNSAGLLIEGSYFDPSGFAWCYTYAYIQDVGSFIAKSEDCLSAIATKLGTPLMLDSYTSDMFMQSWGRSSYARVMIKLRVNVELKDNIVVAMRKITREGHYTCNVRVEYEWKPHRCSSCTVFGHINEECSKNTSVGEKKTVKKPSQTSRGVPVGPKMGFKPQKEYLPVSKKHNASSSGNKKKCVEPTIEVNNSNSFDVFNSVDNDVEFGTNGETTNLVNNEATSSGYSFMHVDNDGEFASNNPIGEKINKIERQICEGKLRLLDNDGNPLVPTDGSDKGYGTNSLLEQWRNSYLDNDDYEPYDDDMYENHDLSEHL
nr:hypothetical protein [Tanacetum cinerariifolium]